LGASPEATVAKEERDRVMPESLPAWSSRALLVAEELRCGVANVVVAFEGAKEAKSCSLGHIKLQSKVVDPQTLVRTSAKIA
jgi:hypothetical protein